MDANTPYQILQFLVDKDQNGYLPPDRYNLIINQAQRSYFTFMIGEYQQYQNGRPIARVEIGMNEKIMQTLAPFISEPSTLTIDGSGNAVYPDYYQVVNAIYWGTSFKRVRFVTQDKLYSYYNSVIDPIATNPIYLIKDTGFQFYPITLGTALLSYVSTPPDIVWGYVEDLNGQLVYDSTTSTPPLWFDIDMYQIIVRAGQMLGVNLQFAEVEQYATSIKNQGE